MRNESAILKDTLDAWAKFCTEGIYIVDDVSTDNSVEIARAHPAVRDVQVADFWDPHRERAEWFLRQMALIRAQQDSGPDDWFVYFDADEFLYDFTDYELFEKPEVKAIACRLWDVYITPEDKDKSWKEREMVGPEYRTIPFFFRNSPYLRYQHPDQRIVDLEPGIQIPVAGSIKHFGKGFSVAQWEKTVDYYVKFWPKYAEKWRKRKGKAIHDGYSDFGNKLVHWKDRHQGFSLEDQSYGKN